MLRLFCFLSLLLLGHSSFIPGTCEPGSCLNDGQCYRGPNSNTYWCKCVAPYEGSRCEHQPCIPYCQNGGLCIRLDNSSFVCKCPPGFLGASCQPDPSSSCPPERCSLNGDCRVLDSIQGFHCDCRSGWTGVDCSLKTNDCACMNGGKCLSSSSTGSSPKCLCEQGFTGSLCEIDIDECLDNPCDRGTCLNQYGSFECACEVGWTGLTCSHRSRIDECSTNGPKSCQNGGFCEKGLLGKYKCTCPPMFHGEFCELDVDECLDRPCLNGGTCRNSHGDFECFCTAEYMGKNCENQRDSCEHNKCAPGSTCVNEGNSYSCECPNGRTGLYCDKMDECVHQPCLNGDCLTDRTSGDFSCRCRAGFAGSRCSEDIDECERDSPCLHGATCVNTQGAFACQCAPGYFGKRCEHFIEECQGNPCRNGGSCFANDTCFCQPGYGGRHCETILGSACAESCLNERTCFPDGNGGFSCQCPEGRYGENCELKSMIETQCQTNSCEHGGLCRSISGSSDFQCFCLLGWEGDRCEKATDYCSPSPCLNGGRCVNDLQGAECICEPNFEGSRCERLVDSCLPGSCLNEAECIDGHCRCETGFSGKRCEIVECQKVGCQNGGSCQLTNEHSKCECQLGFSGSFCEIVEKTCTPGYCLNQGTCVKEMTSIHCDCPRGFFGETCQFWTDVNKFNATDLEEKKRCQERGCEDLANNGHCDPECNYYACDYDGGDCSAQDKPYAKCRAGNYCAREFHNGICDEVCNNEACLFDGFDCAHSGRDQCPSACRPLSQDGKCDSWCNIASCGFDGGDCEKRPTKLSGEVEVIILVRPEVFISMAKDMLVDVSALLRSTVRIARDSMGPKAFVWTLEGGTGDRLLFPPSESLSAVYDMGARMRRKVVISGVKVFLEIDVASCSELCFSDPSAAASFVSAAVANKQLSVPIYSALAVGHKSQDSKDKWGPIGLCAILLTILVSIGVAGARIIPNIKDRKRKRVCNAHVWTPPTEEKLNEMNAKTLKWNECLPYGYSYGHMGYIKAEPPNDKWYNPIKIPKIERPVYDAPTELHWEAITGEPFTKNRKGPVDVNAVTVHAQTALHLLVSNENSKETDIVARVEDLVINQGAEIDVLDQDDMTPLFVAVLKNRVKVAEKLILLGANTLIAARDGTTILHQTMKNSDLGMLRMLLKHEEVKKMVEVVDDANRTPLMVLARHHLLDDQMAAMLVEAGAEVNSQGDKSRTDQTGATALHFAAASNNTAMIRFLIERNANKDAQDRIDRTPLFIAAEKNFVEAVILLVQSQASTEIADQKDRTPLDVAKECECREVVAILEKASLRLPQQPPEKQALPAPQRTVRARRGMAREPTRKARALHPDTPPSSDRSDYSSPSPVDGITRTGAKRESVGNSRSSGTLPALSLPRSNQSAESLLPVHGGPLPDASNVLTPPQKALNATWNAQLLNIPKLPEAPNVLTPPQNANGSGWNPSPPYDFHGVSIEYGDALYGGSDPFGPPCGHPTPTPNHQIPPSTFYNWQTNV